jgi:predicted nucleic acid-binding protein
MTTFVDTNVLIYLQDPASKFHGWAKSAVAERRAIGPLIICDIVCSELSVAMNSVAETDEVVRSLAIERYRFSNLVLFRAGKAFAKYKSRGGQKLNVLSDFLIGAQAEVEGAPLLTNNAREFVSYFPKAVLIKPAP